VQVYELYRRCLSAVLCRKKAHCGTDTVHMVHLLILQFGGKIVGRMSCKSYCYCHTRAPVCVALTCRGMVGKLSEAHYRYVRQGDTAGAAAPCSQVCGTWQPASDVVVSEVWKRQLSCRADGCRAALGEARRCNASAASPMLYIRLKFSGGGGRPQRAEVDNVAACRSNDERPATSKWNEQDQCTRKTRWWGCCLFYICFKMSHLMS